MIDPRDSDRRPTHDNRSLDEKLLEVRVSVCERELATLSADDIIKERLDLISEHTDREFDAPVNMDKASDVLMAHHLPFDRAIEKLRQRTSLPADLQEKLTIIQVRIRQDTEKVVSFKAEDTLNGERFREVGMEDAYKGCKDYNDVIIPPKGYGKDPRIIYERQEFFEKYPPGDDW